MRSARLALLLLLAAACASTPPAPPPEVHSDLIAMRVADQEVRKRWIADRQNPAIIEEMKTIDAKNVARLLEIVRMYGWPVQSKVGREAAGAAWMIAQHSGAEVLHEMLPKMKIAADNGGRSSSTARSSTPTTANASRSRSKTRSTSKSGASRWACRCCANTPRSSARRTENNSAER
jgi:hypothetical protein